MKTIQFIPALISFYLIIGIIIGYYLEPNSTIVIVSICAFLIMLGGSHYITNRVLNKIDHFSIIQGLLFISIGIASITFQSQLNDKKHYSNHISLGNNNLVFEIKKRLKSNIYYDKYIAEVSQLNEEKTIGSILINVPLDTLNPYKIGAVYFVNSKLKEIPKPLNPYQFDYQNYLRKQQVYHQISIRKNALFIRHNTTIYEAIEVFRNKITTSLKKHHFKKNEISIINALLLGQRQGVSKDLLQNYIDAGAIHILAVSGLHIGVLYFLLSFLFKPIEYLKKGRIIKVILIIIFLWLYAFLAGLSPSIIRAVAMFTAVGIGGFSQKRTITLHSLFISMFVLLLINPLYLFSVGFQLSYLAVFSIVFFYPLFLKLYLPKNKIIRFFWQIFAVSLSAQIAILPLSLFYFHQFPSLFFISSLVIIPFLGLLLGLGILIISLALLDILPLFLGQFYGLIIKLMNNFIRFIAEQENFLFKNIPFSIVLLLASYLLIGLLYRFWYKPTIVKLHYFMLGILIFQSILLFEKCQKENTNQFIIFNQSRKSLFTHQKGNNVGVYSDLDSISLFNNYAFKNYQTKKGALQINRKKEESLFSIEKQSYLIIDSLGIYSDKKHIDIIILTQSPKINLNRLIATVSPTLVIADASNYINYRKKWKSTCTELRIPFHDTSKDGAYIVEY